MPGMYFAVLTSEAFFSFLYLLLNMGSDFSSGGRFHSPVADEAFSYLFSSCRDCSVYDSGDIPSSSFFFFISVSLRPWQRRNGS